jgi:hypothetical protein
MQTFNDRLQLEFAKLIEQEIEEIKEWMSLGTVMNWEQYKYMTGKIAGFNRALEVLEEAHKALLNA